MHERQKKIITKTEFHIWHICVYICIYIYLFIYLFIYFSVLHQHTTGSPEPKPHLIPTTAISCSPEMPFSCGPQNCHPHVVPTPAIACSPELPSSCGPHNCHHMWFPELTSVCGPHHWHHVWSPELICTNSRSQQLLSITEMDRLSSCPQTATDYWNLCQCQENVFHFHHFLRET